MRDLSIDPVQGTIRSIPLFLALVALVAVPHWLLWHENPISAAFRPLGILSTLGLFAAAVVVHS